MTFDDITGDGRLWAVKYDGDHDNILAMTFERWNDLPYRIINYLKSFWVKKRFQKNSYLITGGAIKLTRTMQEREHTLAELQKLEQVRNFLISEGAFDLDGFYDLTKR